MQRHYFGDEDPLAEVNYRVQRAARAEMVAEAARQLAARPRSPRPVSALNAHSAAGCFVACSTYIFPSGLHVTMTFQTRLQGLVV